MLSCLFLQSLSFLLQAVSLQCLYKTELVIKKTKLHLRSCLFLQALSFLLQVVSFVRPESTKDRACKRKDTTCNHKRQRLYYKLCLFSLSALIPWRRLDVDISTLTPVVERQRRGTRSLSVKHYTVVKLPLRARKVKASIAKRVQLRPQISYRSSFGVYGFVMRFY